MKISGNWKIDALSSAIIYVDQEKRSKLFLIFPFGARFDVVFGFSKNSGNHTDGFSFGGWSLLAASPVVRETPAMEQGNERETPASERRTACEA